MKIKIAEQMMQSYLKNVEGCQIVQTNWTPLVTELSDERINVVKLFIDEAKRVVDEDLDIIKKSTINQFISQCEIDVVGLKVIGGSAEQVYLIDTAFHQNNLGYKNSVSKVIQKMIKQSIVSYLFFDEIKSVVAFATPKVSVPVSMKINKNVRDLSSIISHYFPNIELRFIYGNEFSGIIDLLISNVDSSGKKDDNDLFIRSVLLLKAAGNDLPLSKSSIKSKDHDCKTKHSDVAKTEKGSNKRIVFDGVKRLLDNGLMDDSMIRNLTNQEFTQRTFKIASFPFLINYDNTSYDEKRFYPEKFRINGNDYKICSQWIPSRIDRFTEWLNNLIK